MTKTIMEIQDIGKVLHVFLVHYLILKERELEDTLTCEQRSLGKFLDKIVLHNNYRKLKGLGFTYKYPNDRKDIMPLLETLLECCDTELKKKSSVDQEKILKEVLNVSTFVRSSCELIDAVSQGNLELAAKCLDNGASPNFLCIENFQSVVNLAIENQYPGIAKLLIKRGADIFNNDKVSKVYHEGDQRKVRFYSHGGKSPLLLAAQHGYEDVVELILNKGVDPNKRSETLDSVPHEQQRNVRTYHRYKGEKTPLHAAVQFEHKKVVELLLSRSNTDIYIEDIVEEIEYAAHSHGNLEILRLLFSEVKHREEASDKILEILRAVVRTRPHYKIIRKEIVELFLKEMSYGGKYDDELLHNAAQSGQADIVKLFIERGADVNVARFGVTPMHYVALDGNVEIAGLLLKNGAKANIQDGYGQTPLHCAASGGHVDVVNFLLENGAKVSIDTQDKNGDTPLNCAIKACKSSSSEQVYVGVVESLLNKGANPHVHDINGEPPLYHAVKIRGAYLVQLLLDKGADPKIKSKGGKTLLDHALKNSTDPYHWGLGGKEIVLLLIGKTVNNEKDLLDRAINHGAVSLLNFLINEKVIDPNVLKHDARSLETLYYASGDSDEALKFIAEYASDEIAAKMLPLVSPHIVGIFLGYSGTKLRHNKEILLKKLNEKTTMYIEKLRIVMDKLFECFGDNAKVLKVMKKAVENLKCSDEKAKQEVEKRITEKLEVLSKRDNMTPLLDAIRNGYVKKVRSILEKVDESFNIAFTNEEIHIAIEYAINKAFFKSVESLINYQLKMNSDEKKPDYISFDKRLSHYWDERATEELAITSSLSGIEVNTISDGPARLL